MKIKKDGHLVEPLDPDVDAKSQKTPKKKQTGSEQPSRKSPRSEFDPKDGNEGNLPSAVETSRKGKGKVTESSHRPDVDTNVDIPADDRRALKIGMMASRLEMDASLSTPIGQTSADIVNNNDEQRFGLSEVNKALKMWRADNVIAGVSFVRGHRTLQDEVDRMGIDVYYQSLLNALKGAAGTLPNSLVVFEYMRSIFDSYVNPSNDPNVQPLVKGLDADDFFVDKFFGLQDPTSPDDVQARPDFEEDLRTNERLRLQAEVRNLGAEPQRVTRSTHVCLDYQPTILPDVPPTDNPACPVTLDLSMDAREDASSPPPS
ncbi:hypothetical protein R1flu_018953 [Riccia fluitans]|uniref:Uncharacterized protein n=1 Tax=Riccia fluitans TaxID=41844 RepID=A0ABD1ZIS3_9MARC